MNANNKYLLYKKQHGGVLKLIHLRAKHWFLFFSAIILVISLVFTNQLCNDNNLFGNLKTNSQQDNSKVIIIDAGHGGFDGGAIGSNGTIEKDINLAISLKLRNMLEKAGYTVVMTRDIDTALNDTEDTSTRKKKISDMHNRLNLTKLYPGSTLISIHQNKLDGNSTVHGGQIFYSPNQESSQTLAQYIQDEFNAYVQPEKPREIVKTGKNLYLFYNAQNTAVLCECGFLSNPDEEALLNTDEYQSKIAYCIFSGIILCNDSNKSK